MSNKIIQIENLHLNVDNKTVLENISLEADKGEIIGIVGRNGSGKSMLFKTIVGFFVPQKGTIKVKDSNILEKGKFPNNIGALIENPGFLPSYTGFKNLKLLASIQRKINEEEIKKVITQVGLEKSMHQKVKKYSVGMKQRLGIAQAYMENPDIIILDEPTSGLDKQGVADIRELLQDLSNKGTTIFIASHIQEDIDNLSTKVYEMEQGRITPSIV